MNVCKTYRAAAYLRLSKEDSSLFLDNGRRESNSITNQKSLILKAVELIPDFILCDFYIDDGFSGLNFNRPDFCRMEQDILAGKINAVIVKDLSRFGRDYIEVGRYIKKVFPKLGVRFLSVLDHFDSFNASENDKNLMIPIKNFLNDNYSRDISMKIRSNQSMMRRQGLYIGAYAPYGYQKSEENKHCLVTDQEAAKIVRKIFDWKLEGKSAQSIATTLNDLGVFCPSEYKERKGTLYKSGFQTKLQGSWSAVTILRILSNKVYLGTLEQGKRQRLSYKLTKVLERPEQEWDVVPDTHEAIVSKSDFENVARLLKLETRKIAGKETVALFAGILFCGDCYKAMNRRVVKYKQKETIYYICSSNNRGNGCSRHSIKEEDIKNILLNLLNQYKKSFAGISEYFEKIELFEVQNEEALITKTELEWRQEELEHCEKQLCILKQDFEAGILSKEEYHEFKQNFEEEMLSLKKSFGKVEQKATKNLGTAWSRKSVISFLRKIEVYEENKIKIYF